jgi:hypothetical protein
MFEGPWPGVERVRGKRAPVEPLAEGTIEVSVLVGPPVLGLRRPMLVQFRDGLLILGRRSYDESQVTVWPIEHPLRLQLRLIEGSAVQNLTLSLATPEQSADFYTAVARWLSAQADEADEREDVANERMMLEWEISRTQEEEALRHTLVLTILVLCKRMFRTPAQFTVLLLVLACFGLGMVQAVWDEFEARNNGLWIDASCEIDSMHFSIEFIYNPNLGPLWKVTGMYDVSVRFDDGCDDGLWQMAPPRHRSAIMVKGHGDGEIVFFESYDTTEDGSTFSEPDNPLQLEPDLPDDEPDPLPPVMDESLVRPPSANHSGSYETCSFEHDRRLDPLRGEHVAYHRLVLGHNDFCYGPKGSNATVALAYCKNTQVIWFTHRYVNGTHTPCYIFKRAMEGGKVEAHVVLNKRIPLVTRAYIAYWLLLGLLLLWLVVLSLISCLQRLELMAGWMSEKITAESTDMLSLAGGVGQPGSELAAHVEQMYKQEAVAGTVTGRPSQLRAGRADRARDPRRRSGLSDASASGIAPFLPLL